MRPTLFVRISAVLSIVTVAAIAAADNPPPPTFTYDTSKGTVTVTPAAGSGTHLNRNFPWSIKDTSATPPKVLKQKSDFNFAGGSAPDQADSASVPLVAGTMKGGYCASGNCYTFTASCTTAKCTVTGS